MHRWYLTHQADQRAQGRARYHANREKRLVQMKEARRGNLEKRRAADRARYAANRDALVQKARDYRGRLGDVLVARRYGITVEEYRTLLAKCDGACHACHRHVKLAVDHDHDTGLVRGLLCNSCNVAGGQLEDSIERIAALLRYFKEAKKCSNAKL